MAVKKLTYKPAVLTVPSVPEDTSASGGASKTSRLLLRDGLWHADGVPVADYRDALKLTLQAAAISLPPKPTATTRKPRKPKPVPVPARLEDRAWWPAYVAERDARRVLAEKRRSVEETIREREAEYDALVRQRREWEAQRRQLWLAHAETLPEVPRSPTLRERALAAIAAARCRNLSAKGHA